MFPQNRLRERRKLFKMENELMHFGVKGMRWGVRRYQNKDGTLIRRKTRRNEFQNEDYKIAKSLKKKKLNQMSNAELRKLTERQQLERNYSNLNPNLIKKGIVAVAAIAGALGTIVSIKNNGAALINMGKKIGQKTISKIGKKAI